MKNMENPAQDRSDDSATRRWPALVICLVASFMTLFDVSVVTIASPSMEHSLHMTPAEITWALAGYALTFGLTLIPAGRLGDEHGRRTLFLIGLALFAVTGVICGLAPNAVVLIIGRLLRGVSAGILAPQVIALLQQMYPKKTRGRAFGYYGATTGMSTALGLLIGGVILQAFGPAMGWRWIFYLSIPILLVALVIGFKVLHLRVLRIRSYAVGTAIATAFYTGVTALHPAR